MPSPDPVESLLQRPRFGAGLGLHRMLEALDALGPDWRGRLDAIKITGSNGKGSTSTMVARILEALGLSVGLYTSPHLRRVHERIVIHGQPVEDDALRRGNAWALERETALHRRDPDDHFGGFEVLTLVAMHCFAEADVDVVVAEAGIGGRYDPTRAIPGRTCGVVSVEREHTALLGETEEAIAFDKADLCPPDGELVAGPLAPGLRRRLHAYCRLRRVSLHCTDLQTEHSITGASAEGTVLRLVSDDLAMEDLMLAAPGRHQVDNAAVAVQLVQRWLRRHRPDVTAVELGDAIRRALGSIRLPGRLERICEEPLVLVDVGHTAAAMAQVARSLPPLLADRDLLLVTGVSHDRDPAILAPLLPLATEVVCTRAHHRSGDPVRIATIVEATRPGLSHRTVPTIEDAMAIALERAREHGMAILVTGGLFVAMEAVCVVEHGDPRSLRFF